MQTSEWLPYVVSVLCAVISGIFSYIVSRKQSKNEIAKLDKQFSIEIEKERERARLELEMEREKFKMEKEKLNIEHKHQLELKDNEMKNQLGTDLISTVTKEYMRSPAGQAQMRNSSKKKSNKKKK